MSNEPDDRSGRNSSFGETRWSLVLKAGEPSSQDSRQALEALCEIYWYPLYAYVRRLVNDRCEAEDLTQAFFAELLAKNYVATATPERGRFRAFLVTACKHFVSKQWQKAKTQKQGGGRHPISLDFDSADTRFKIEPSSGLTAEQIYERQWAFALLDHTMQRLQSEFVRAGKESQFSALKDFLTGQQERTFAEVAEQLGTTPAAAKMAASRMRGRYREIIREEIMQTVSVPEEVEDETRKLFAALEF